MNTFPLWNSPVEQFRWNGLPMELPVVVQIRDREKRPIFYIGLNTREYDKVEKFENEIVPKIVEMMNAYGFTAQTVVGPDENALSGNNHSSPELPASVDHPKPKKRGNPWGRKGKPK